MCCNFPSDINSVFVCVVGGVLYISIAGVRLERLQFI